MRRGRAARAALGGIAWAAAMVLTSTSCASPLGVPAPSTSGSAATPSSSSAPHTSSVESQPVSPTTPSQDIAALLAGITAVKTLPNVPGYERSCGPGKGCVFGPAWKDVDRTGCDTRNRVLATQLRNPVFKPGTRNCKVVSGTLDDPYGATTLSYPGSGQRGVEIDHIFPLARAWDAGAASWPVEDRERFANDLDNLQATSGVLNAAKGDSGPDSWLPPNTKYACEYVQRYLRVAAKYQLLITQSDGAAAQRACR